MEDVTISYTGAVDIGDRTIQQARLGNYWNDGGIKKKAIRETGIPADGSECCSDTMHCLSYFCLLCCCAGACVASERASRLATLNGRIDTLASIEMSKAIAEMLKAADTQVTNRIQHKESSRAQQQFVAQPQVAPGSVTLSQEQFAALLRAQQPQSFVQWAHPPAGGMGAGSAGAAGAGPSAEGVPFIPQYQAQPLPSAPPAATVKTALLSQQARSGAGYS